MSKDPPKGKILFSLFVEQYTTRCAFFRMASSRENVLLKSNLQLPIFVCDEPDAKQEIKQINFFFFLEFSISSFFLFFDQKKKTKQKIKTLPEHYRWGVNRLSELLDPLVKKGLESVLLFGVLTDEKDTKKSLKFQKDNQGGVALSNLSPVVLAITYLKKKYPHLLISCDVCLCAYTDHGHCGLLDKDGYIDNKARYAFICCIVSCSIEQIAEVAAHYARAGAHVVAPSDMMDGRTKAIKAKLHQYGLAGRCAVKHFLSFYFFKKKKKKKRGPENID
ncbi:delta-aminolevulinic acid dehydratase [Reticulomyxa filosa]|uniref:porphobilinogen synthase n=1 Tax=Reticulomyxa filosa TaxID=46433 RepID=X6MHA8_RETFI|nr:delta-aminolevulinic acid dehydratase [Reticulomyxa filosa]|eukprot:ETO13056.1 delta-aminolevulinic acid dehydratase [Reticulomyxa filosa]